MALIQITWSEGLTLKRDPDDIEDYKLTLSEWLNGELISTSSVIPETGINASYLEGVGLSYIGFRISGGTAGRTYRVTIRAATASGRSVDHSINFYVLNR